MRKDFARSSKLKIENVSCVFPILVKLFEPFLEVQVVRKLFYPLIVEVDAIKDDLHHEAAKDKVEVSKLKGFCIVEAVEQHVKEGKLQVLGDEIVLIKIQDAKDAKDKIDIDKLKEFSTVEAVEHGVKADQVESCIEVIMIEVEGCNLKLEAGVINAKVAAKHLKMQIEAGLPEVLDAY